MVGLNVLPVIMPTALPNLSAASTPQPTKEKEAVVEAPEKP